MLTLFSIPKPFEGHIAVIQRNAIQSWSRFKPACEVILCGDDDGTEEAARDFGARYVPGIARNSFGTPLVNSVFAQVEKITPHPWLCYVNADIILLGSFIPAMQSVRFREFLMVGQRWDLDVQAPICFGTNGWEEYLKKQVAENGLLHPPTGIDYFVFPRGMMWAIPPFAVGRPGWDNWLIYRARQIGLPVIDATRVVTAIHQNHDYAHVKPSTDGGSEGPEAEDNRKLVGGWENFFTIRDATHRLSAGESAVASGSFVLRKKIGTLPVPVLRARKKLGYVAGAAARSLRRGFRAKHG